MLNTKNSFYFYLPDIKLIIYVNNTCRECGTIINLYYYFHALNHQGVLPKHGKRSASTKLKKFMHYCLNDQRKNYWSVSIPRP